MNAIDKQGIFLLMLTHWTLAPLVISAHRHLQRLAEYPDGILLPMFFNELILASAGRGQRGRPFF
jgi:hypothetical protein